MCPSIPSTQPKPCIGNLHIILALELEEESRIELRMRVPQAVCKKWCSSPQIPTKCVRFVVPSDGFGIRPSMNSCVAHSDPRVMCRRITLKVSRKLLTPGPEICDLIVDAKPAKLRRPEGVLMFTISLLIHLQHVDMNLPTTVSTFTNNQITGFYRICLAEFATREWNRDTVDDLGFILTQELAKRMR